ncbi:MAG: hypothetical protein OXT06_29315 [Rhodospirillaceae bacterium]|nr:hypothetical protein [Rhodospirillaceae bacterium]
MPITDADIARAIQKNLAKLQLLPDVTTGLNADSSASDTEADGHSTD